MYWIHNYIAYIQLFPPGVGKWIIYRELSGPSVHLSIDRSSAYLSDLLTSLSITLLIILFWLGSATPPFHNPPGFFIYVHTYIPHISIS